MTIKLSQRSYWPNYNYKDLICKNEKKQIYQYAKSFINIFENQHVQYKKNINEYIDLIQKKINNASLSEDDIYNYCKIISKHNNYPEESVLKFLRLCVMLAKHSTKNNKINWFGRPNRTKSIIKLTKIKKSKKNPKLQDEKLKKRILNRVDMILAENFSNRKYQEHEKKQLDKYKTLFPIQTEQVLIVNIYSFIKNNYTFKKNFAEFIKADSLDKLLESLKSLADNLKSNIQDMQDDLDKNLEDYLKYASQIKDDNKNTLIWVKKNNNIKFTYYKIDKTYTYECVEKKIIKTYEEISKQVNALLNYIECNNLFINSSFTKII